MTTFSQLMERDSIWSSLPELQAPLFSIEYLEEAGIVGISSDAMLQRLGVILDLRFASGSLDIPEVTAGVLIAVGATDLRWKTRAVAGGPPISFDRAFQSIGNWSARSVADHVELDVRAGITRDSDLHVSARQLLLIVGTTTSSVKGPPDLGESSLEEIRAGFPWWDHDLMVTGAQWFR